VCKFYLIRFSIHSTVLILILKWSAIVLAVLFSIQYILAITHRRNSGEFIIFVWKDSRDINHCGRLRFRGFFDRWIIFRFPHLEEFPWAAGRGPKALAASKIAIWKNCPVVTLWARFRIIQCIYCSPPLPTAPRTTTAIPRSFVFILHHSSKLPVHGAVTAPLMEPRSYKGTRPDVTLSTDSADIVGNSIAHYVKITRLA